MSRWRRLVRRVGLRLLKVVGLFTLARRWGRGRLRIIAWHGLSAHDEHDYDDVLFMRPVTFERRLKLLEQVGATVLPLDEALERLAVGTLPDLPVVLTMDDGWATSAGAMADSLARHRFPATLYVSTDYTLRPWFPVFDVAAGWLLWRATRSGTTSVDLTAVEPSLGVMSLATDSARRDAHQRLRQQGDTLDVAARTRLLAALADVLGEDVSSSALVSADLQSLARLGARGIDVQLHTHHHRMPAARHALEQEIADNRAHLRPAARRSLQHLCFPSGEYQPEQLVTLQALGITTAVTCRSGLNDASTPRLELRRFLDRDSLTDLEVEAELCGVLPWLRAAHEALSTRLAVPPTRSAT